MKKIFLTLLMTANFSTASDVLVFEDSNTSSSQPSIVSSQILPCPDFSNFEMTPNHNWVPGAPIKLLNLSLIKYWEQKAEKYPGKYKMTFTNLSATPWTAIG